MQVVNGVCAWVAWVRSIEPRQNDLLLCGRYRKCGLYMSVRQFDSIVTDAAVLSSDVLTVVYNVGAHWTLPRRDAMAQL